MRWEEFLQRQFPDDQERIMWMEDVFARVRRRQWGYYRAMEPVAEHYMYILWEKLLKYEMRNPSVQRDDAANVLTKMLSTAFMNERHKAWHFTEKLKQAEPVRLLQESDEARQEAMESRAEYERLMAIFDRTLSEWAEADAEERRNMPSFARFFFDLGPDQALTFWRGSGTQWDQARLVDKFMETYGLDRADRGVAEKLVKRGLENLKKRLETRSQILEGRKAP
jgi:hypothetical protein